MRVAGRVQSLKFLQDEPRVQVHIPADGQERDAPVSDAQPLDVGTRKDGRLVLELRQCRQGGSKGNGLSYTLRIFDLAELEIPLNALGVRGTVVMIQDDGEVRRRHLAINCLRLYSKCRFQMLLLSRLDDEVKSQQEIRRGYLS